MKGQVTVLSVTGDKIGMTYERRAFQLVGKNRAVWADGSRSAIRLSDSHKPDLPPGACADCEKEAISMDHTEKSEPFGNGKPAGAHSEEPGAAYAAAEPVRSAMIDEELYVMAKKRIEERFALIMHWGAFAICQLVFLTLNAAFDWYWARRYGVTLLWLADVCWLVGVVMHTLYYFAKITPRKVQREYERLAKGRY